MRCTEAPPLIICEKPLQASNPHRAQHRNKRSGTYVLTLILTSIPMYTAPPSFKFTISTLHSAVSSGMISRAPRTCTVSGQNQCHSSTCTRHVAISTLEAADTRHVGIFIFQAAVSLSIIGLAPCVCTAWDRTNFARRPPCIIF